MTPQKVKYRAPRTDRTSALLGQVLHDLPAGPVKIGKIVSELRTRSFGGLFILLAAFGLLPGISLLAGLALIVPGVQLAIGFKTPVLPRFIRERSVDSGAVKKIGSRLLPWITWLENYIRPRWIPLTLSPISNIVGIVFVALALVLILPLPFSNFPPAVALITLSLGLMERDGLFLSVGLMVSIIALLIGGFMVSLALNAGAALM